MNQCPHNKVRLQALRAWMELQGLSYGKIAQDINVSEQFIAQVMGGIKKLPAKRREQLLDMGLPEHLLPAPGCNAKDMQQKRR